MASHSASCGSGMPKRKAKQMLTLIPEQERSIDYRFEFAIVGIGARTFAESAVNSEMAEAFRPTASHHAHHHEDHHDDHHDDDGHGVNKLRSEMNKLILFCPLGEASKALARVRFTCVETFSDTLPLKDDAQVAMNQAVLFLFHPKFAKEEAAASGSPRTPRGRKTLDEFKSDFLSRCAEVNYHPAHFRPHMRLISFEAQEESEDALATLGASKGVELDAHADDGEDTVMEAMQAICEHLVGRQKERTTIRLDGDSGALLPQNEKSACCVML